MNRGYAVEKCRLLVRNVDSFDMRIYVELQIYLSIEFAWEILQYNVEYDIIILQLFLNIKLLIALQP